MALARSSISNAITATPNSITQRGWTAIYICSSIDVFLTSRYDPASIEILEQIGHVSRLLEAQNAHLVGLVPSVLHDKTVVSWPAVGLINKGTSPSLSFGNGDPQDYYDEVPEPQDEAVLLSESLELAETVFGKCEDILEWPVFEGQFHPSETEALILNPDLVHEDQLDSSFSITSEPNRSSAPSHGIREEETLSLVEDFFLNVHIKNPILDVSDTRRMAKYVMEHGYKWDAPSCLVVGFWETLSSFI